MLQTLQNCTSAWNAVHYLTVSGVQLGKQLQASVKAILEENPLVELERRELLPLLCLEHDVVMISS